MRAFIFVIASVALVAQAWAAVQLNVNAKSGDVVTGERQFRVTAYANDPVTQVEFYVGSELRDTDTSTPYEFQFDSLNEPDGDTTIRFKAYTTKGETGEKTIVVHVDNQVSKGADFHVQKAEGFLSDSKWDDAVTEGRIALKADAKSGPAQRVLARAYLGSGQLDKAQKFAEDAVATNGKDEKSLNLLSVIDLRRAFVTINTGGATSETLDTIRNSLKSAVDARKKVLDMDVDAVGAPTDANAVAYADAAIAAGRYSLAVSVLQPVFGKDQRKTDVADRLAFAQMREGRLADALMTLRDLKKYGTPDAYSSALEGVLDTVTGQDQASDDAIKDAVLSDSENLGVRTAQAFIALSRNKTSVLAKLSADLSRDEGARPEVLYFLSALANRQGRYEDSVKFYERAVLAEPASADIYVEQGNQLIGLSQLPKVDQKQIDQQLEVAKIMFQTALEVRPES